MHLPIRDGIQEALKELRALRYDMVDTVYYLDSFEYMMRSVMVQKKKEVRTPKSKEVAEEGCQTLLRPTKRSTSNTRKRVREQTVSPEASATKKPAEKRRKASNKEEEWVEVSSTKNFQKNKNKPSRTPEKLRRARPESVLIKLAEGIRYASILRELKKRREAGHFLLRGSWSQEDGPPSHSPDQGRVRRLVTNHRSGRHRGCRQKLLRSRTGVGVKGLSKQDTL